SSRACGAASGPTPPRAAHAARVTDSAAASPAAPIVVLRTTDLSPITAGVVRLTPSLSPMIPPVAPRCALILGRREGRRNGVRAAERPGQPVGHRGMSRATGLDLFCTAGATRPTLPNRPCGRIRRLGRSWTPRRARLVLPTLREVDHLLALGTHDVEFG